MIGQKDTFLVRVVHRTLEAEDIVSFELESIEGEVLPRFEPGAHVDIHAPGGFVRQYSLCNSASGSGRYMVAILRDPSSRGGSVAMHNKVNVGDVLQISAPRNHFPLHPEGHSLLFAGGIGLTPMLCMADELHRQGRPFTLNYCARSRSRMAFYDAISQSAWFDKVNFYFDDCVEERIFDIASLLDAASPDTHLYICGPQGYMNAVLEKARSSGWSNERLHYEYFKAEVLHKSTDAAFEVQIASTGSVLAIPADKSIAAVLNEHGFNVSLSCEQGICGTCVTKVLSGVPDHRDSYLLENEREANDQMTLCCSRSKSPQLIIDL